MTKTIATVAACATLLWPLAAQATPTAQQSCDYARITAWKVYESCVENVVAKDAKGIEFNTFVAFARCRHTYFNKWTGFQGRASLAGSTCIGPRFTDNGDQTVTDNLSGLVWEKKDNRDHMPNYSGDRHDADNAYAWGFGYVENGDAFTDFLATLNSGAGFAGANGWRLPTLVELQTILLDFPCSGFVQGSQCTCPSSPCIDPALDSANTLPSYYWSATSKVSSPDYAWTVVFLDGTIFDAQKTGGSRVRAVRGGL